MIKTHRILQHAIKRVRSRLENWMLYIEEIEHGKINFNWVTLKFFGFNNSVQS